MARSKALLIIVVFLFTKAACVSAQADLTADEKTLAYLKKFRADYVKSMLEKKPELIRSYYGDNARLMTEFVKTIVGKDNAMNYYKSFFAGFDFKSYTRDEIEILDIGPMVVEHGQFTAKVVAKSTGKEHELKGKYQNIWEQGENDKLLLITEGWNYNHQVDIGEQLRFKEVPVVDVALRPHLPINSNISFELAALNKLMEATISEHDAVIWSQFYSDNAILFSKGHPYNEGRKAIDEYIENHVKGLPVFEKLDIRNDRIDNLGTYVIEYASHIANWRSGEHSGVGLGKDLRIWRREKDGSLKIFRHIGMYD